MKFLAIALMGFLPFASQAATCPKLEGSYNCVYDGYEIDVKVSERARTGYTSYVVDYGMGVLTVHPDGQPHFIDRIPGVDSVHKFRYRGSCTGNGVSFSGTGELVDGTGTGTMNGSITKSGSRIVIAVNVKAKGEPKSVRFNCN